MIKVDIMTRGNLTLLAKAYLDNLFPKALDGEVYYDYDDENEIKSIYFKSHQYFEDLLKYIDDHRCLFMDSNSSSEWSTLFRTLSSYTVVSEVDFGLLEHYVGLTLRNDNERELDLSILETNKGANESFLKNMKRLYKGYEVTYWGNQKLVIIKMPYNMPEIFKFNITPIIKLLEISNKKLLSLSLYTDSKRDINVVKVEIE